MNKKLLLVIMFTIGEIAFSQVGINTEDPSATLDVVALPTDLTKTDGIIAPRLTGDELRAKNALYNADQTGTLVYVTVADSVPATKTINVTSAGYYYFDGAVWQAVVTSEPWKVVASTDDATLNTQNIYQTGKVAIGRDPSLNSFYTVLYPYLWIDINETGNEAGSSYGILNQMTSNKQGEKIGIQSYIIDNSTSGSGGLEGINSFVSDQSTVARNAKGGSFSYIYNGTKNNGTNNILGLSNSVTFQAVGGPLNTRAIYGNQSSVLISAVGGAITVENLRGFDGVATIGGNQANTVTSDVTGGYFRARFNTISGVSTIPSFIGINGVLETVGTGGTYNITHAAGIRSNINLGGVGNKNITNLYGIQIQQPVLSGGSGSSIANSYGIYIPDFRLAVDNVATAYNFYSAGANTKNYFQGKVGIGAGATAPVSNLKVTGLQNLADNAAALGAGLAIGDFYHTNGVVKVVY